MVRISQEDIDGLNLYSPDLTLESSCRTRAKNVKVRLLINLLAASSVAISEKVIPGKSTTLTCFPLGSIGVIAALITKLIKSRDSNATKLITRIVKLLLINFSLERIDSSFAVYRLIEP